MFHNYNNNLFKLSHFWSQVLWITASIQLMLYVVVAVISVLVSALCTALINVPLYCHKHLRNLNNYFQFRRSRLPVKYLATTEHASTIIIIRASPNRIDPLSSWDICTVYKLSPYCFWLIEGHQLYCSHPPSKHCDSICTKLMELTAGWAATPACCVDIRYWL